MIKRCVFFLIRNEKKKFKFFEGFYILVIWFRVFLFCVRGKGSKGLGF